MIEMVRGGYIWDSVLRGIYMGFVLRGVTFMSRGLGCSLLGTSLYTTLQSEELSRWTCHNRGGG